jgi:hypothetical protein
MSVLYKKPELFLDHLIKGWEGDKNANDMVKHAISAFLLEPNTEFKKMRKKIQAEAVSTDFALVAKDSFNVTVEEDNFDMGWEQAFKQVPLGKNQDSWEIYNVANALAFQLVEEGQRIQVDELSGTKITAYVDYYGGAIGWTDKLKRFRKVAAMLDIASVFRNKYWTNKANIHYTLLAAAAAANVTAYQLAAAVGQLRRDIETIRVAMLALANRNLNKGYGDMANQPMLIYANPNDEARIEAAFRATTGEQANVVGAGVPAVKITTTRSFKRIYTYNTAITSGSPIMVIPKNKIQKADAMQPTTFTAPKDILTLNETQAVWGIFGAIIGDTDQCQEFTLG